MASTRMSKEISFSRSSERRMAMSMSMDVSGLLPRLNSIWTLALATASYGHLGGGALDLEERAGVVGRRRSGRSRCVPLVSGTLTSRSWLRRQWRGRVSGGPSPGEVTSRV